VRFVEKCGRLQELTDFDQSTMDGRIRDGSAYKLGLESTAIFEILGPFAPRLRKSEIDASGHIPGLFNNGFHVVHEGRLRRRYWVGLWCRPFQGGPQQSRLHGGR
jgi:hypothetical protein